MEPTQTEIKVNIKEVMKKIEDEVLKKLNMIGVDLLKEARDRAPQETGNLIANSDYRVDVGNEEASVIVGFNTQYAARLHEDLTLNISRTHNPRAQAKYLEKAYEENELRYGKLLAGGDTE